MSGGGGGYRYIESDEVSERLDGSSVRDRSDTSDTSDRSSTSERSDRSAMIRCLAVFCMEID